LKKFHEGRLGPADGAGLADHFEKPGFPAMAPDGRDDAPAGNSGFTPQSDVPVDNRDFQPAGAPAGGNSAPAEDDIPF